MGALVPLARRPGSPTMSFTRIALVLVLTAVLPAAPACASSTASDTAPPPAKPKAAAAEPAPEPAPASAATAAQDASSAPKEASATAKSGDEKSKGPHLVELTINSNVAEDPAPENPLGPSRRNFRSKLLLLRQISTDDSVAGVRLKLDGNPGFAHAIDLLEELGRVK